MGTTFGNLSYETAFQACSPTRLFNPVRSNVTDATFFLPGSNGGSPATTKAFGAVSADVDQPDGSGPGSRRGNRGASTSVEYYDYAGNLLYSSTVAAAPGTGNLSFIGCSSLTRGSRACGSSPAIFRQDRMMTAPATSC